MKEKSCSSCGHCKRLYDRFHYHYGRTRYYYCTETEKLTTPQSICENWQPKKSEIDLSAQRFDKTEEDIKSIIEYLNNG